MDEHLQVVAGPEELSHRAGLATVQISRIERGKREVRLNTVVRLIDALDIRPDVLLADARDD